MSDTNRTFRDRLRRPKPRVLTSVVANTVNYAVGRGLSMERIEVATGLARADLVNPETFLPEELGPTIWQLLSRAYPGQALSLHMASAAPFSLFGQWALAAQYAENLRSALQVLARYRFVLAERLQMSLIESASEGLFQSHHPLDEIDGGYGIESGFALLTRWLEEVLGVGDALLRVDFAHRPLGSSQAYESFFSVPVCFQQPHSALVFRREALDLPIQQRDPHLLQYIQGNLELLQENWQLISDPGQLSEIYNTVTYNAEFNEYSAEAIARQMNMSLRALQRLANGYGFTIRQLLESSRETKARQLLLNPSLSIETISELLGYSSDRAFRRAFKRWTGQTPAEFRQRLF